MRTFLLRTQVFFLPFLLVVSIPFYILRHSGENFTDINTVIAGDENYLIGYLYNEQNYHYLKWKALATMPKCTIWALGSSRMLQFRSNMFDSSFYNAGYAIAGVGDFKPFLESIPETRHPKYLMVGLDQWMFNAAWDNLRAKPDPMKWSRDFRRYPDVRIIKSTLKDLLSRKVPIAVHGKNPGWYYLGLNSMLYETGFVRDGSFYYGGQIAKLLNSDSTAADFQYKDTYTRINKGNRRFEPGIAVNGNALDALDELLAYCKSRGIQVIGIIPPFADAVNARLVSSGQYEYMTQVFPTASRLFSKYDFELYDFAQLNSCGSNDTEVIDGFHGGEVTYLRILIHMLKSNSVLKNVTDVNRLELDLRKAKSRYEVYPR